MPVPLSESETPSPQLTLWPPDRIAAIDIGSNSVRVVVAQVDASGGYRVVDEERENTRLASEIDRTKRLDGEAMDATITVLRHFKTITEGYQVKQTRAIATSAVRDAENGHEFVERVHRELGLHIDIISAHEEARLSFQSVAKAFDVSERQIAVADIGGGSTEIVLASSGLIDEVYATRLGAVRVSERFDLSEKCDESLLAEATAFVDRRLKQSLRKPPFVPATLFGSGGTFTAMASILMARQGEEERPLRGFMVQRAEVHHLLLDLAKLSLEKRRKAAGLNPRRADIIVGGLLVIERIMKRLNVNTVCVHSRGVRDGLLLTMIQQSAPRITTGEERTAAVERLARNCGVDLPHARQVARIAGLLWNQLAEPLELKASDQELLEAAALLANVGYLINYEKHHKHSYHLILNSELSGFERRELLILANVARYHRGAAPKRKHKGYNDLSQADRERVAKMASILRLALALDRTHQQQVRDLRCRVLDERVEITLQATGDAEVDLWAARRKVDLFEKTFGRQLFFAEVSDQAS